MKPIGAMFGSPAASPPEITYLNRIFNTTGGSRSVAVTPAIDDLLIIVCQATGTTSFTVTDDQGGTYTTVVLAAKNSSADGLEIHVRNQLVTAAISHTVTMTVTSTSGSGLAVFKVTNMGAAGLSAIRQFANQNNQTSIGTPAPAFGAAVLAKNPIFGCCYQGGLNIVTPRAGYTEHFDESYNTPATAWECMSIDGGETSQTITWGGITGSTSWASCVIELKAP